MKIERAAAECLRAAAAVEPAMRGSAPDPEARSLFKKAAEEAKRTFWRIREQTAPIIAGILAANRELTAQRDAIEQLCEKASRQDAEEAKANLKRMVAQFKSAASADAPSTEPGCSASPEGGLKRCSMFELLHLARYGPHLIELARHLQYIADVISTMRDMQQPSSAGRAAVVHYGAGNLVISNVTDSTVGATIVGDNGKADGSVRHELSKSSKAPAGKRRVSKSRSPGRKRGA